MQPINFIKTVSPKEQRSLQSWYTCIITLCALMCICIGTVQTLQLMHLYKIRNEKASVQQQQIIDQPILDALHTLQVQTNNVQKRLDLITQHINQQRRLNTYLKVIKKSLSEKTIESYSMTPTKLNLTFMCSSPDKAIGLIRLLKQQLPDIQELHLASLQPSQTHYNAHIQGKIS